MLGMKKVPVYLQSLHQLLSSGDVGNVNGCAEGVQHLHFVKDVSAAGGSDDQQLPTLRESQVLGQTCEATVSRLFRVKLLILPAGGPGDHLLLTTPPPPPFSRSPHVPRQEGERVKPED